MTPAEIASLPTSECDRSIIKILSSLQSGTEDVVRADLAKSLERRLGAAVMALESIMQSVRTSPEIRALATETLAAIKDDFASSMRGFIKLKPNGN